MGAALLLEQPWSFLFRNLVTSFTVHTYLRPAQASQPVASEYGCLPRTHHFLPAGLWLSHGCCLAA